MAEYIIQYKNKAGDKLYPVTLTTAIVDNSGENLEVKLSKVEESIQSLTPINERLTVVESSTNTLLTKVEDLEERVSSIEENVNILNAESNVEGSVDNKIDNALNWSTL